MGVGCAVENGVEHLTVCVDLQKLIGLERKRVRPKELLLLSFLCLSVPSASFSLASFLSLSLYVSAISFSVSFHLSPSLIPCGVSVSLVPVCAPVSFSLCPSVSSLSLCCTGAGLFELEARLPAGSRSAVAVLCLIDRRLCTKEKERR